MQPTLPSLPGLRKVASAAWPERKLRKFRRVQGGWANLVLEAEGELIFRFPRRVEVARSLSFEVRVLDYLSRNISTPIPIPRRIGQLDHPKGWPFLVYQKLPGLPLLDYRPLQRAERAKLRTFVLRLLTELAGLAPRAAPPSWLQTGCPQGVGGVVSGARTSLRARRGSESVAPVRSGNSGPIRCVPSNVGEVALPPRPIAPRSGLLQHSLGSSTG